MFATAFCLASAASAVASCIPTHRQFESLGLAAKDVIERGFVIIGVGAAGTYAAISLTDQNKTLTLIEVTDRLGGNTRTFHNPAKRASHLAVVQLQDFGMAQYYDFTEWIALTNYTPGTIKLDHITVLDKDPYVENLIDLLNHIPADLLLTWPQFVEKYNPSTGSAEGGLSWPATPGNPLNTTALAIFNNGNHFDLEEFDGAGLHSANYDNFETYINALAELKPHVLMNSSVVAAQRQLTSQSSIQPEARSPSCKKLIRAKQLIVAMPPILENTESLSLDKQKEAISSKPSGKQYHGGVMNNTGLEEGVAYSNAGVDRSYHVANLPGVVEIAPSHSPGYFFYWYNSVQAQTQAKIEDNTRNTIKCRQTEVNATTLELNLFDFQDFSSFCISALTPDFANGWYSEMKGLQGHKNTWYIRILFVVGSTQIWNNTRNLLP